MSKHTPRPWDIWETVNGYEICEPTKPTRHSYFASLGIGGFGWEEQKANAKLIAAAPDLLTALIDLFESYKSLADSGDAGFWKLEDTIEGKQALSAIAKATS